MPTRYLKPGICDSDAIDKCSLAAENLFYRLLVTVDDFGRFDARPSLIRGRCYPLKENMKNSEVEESLLELHEKRLIFIYEVNGYNFLQFMKWDNVPRSKVSKFPEPNADAMQMHASVRNPSALLPVTVTETKTETVNRNGNGNRDNPLATGKPAAPKKTSVTADSPALQAACKTTWMKYGEAYLRRYGVAPTRNAKVSAIIKQFVQRIGLEESPYVAAFYVDHNEAFYVKKLHPVDLMLKDAEGLRTQWITKHTMTGTRAQQIDKTQTNASVVEAAMQLSEGREHAAQA